MTRYTTRMTLLLITFCVFAISVALMAIGYILSGRCIKGSCGGEALYDTDGEMINCDTCPARKEKEREAAALGTRVS